jgi:hypothetical protein
MVARERFNLGGIIQSYRELRIKLYRVLRTRDGILLTKQINEMLNENHSGKIGLLILFLNSCFDTDREVYLKFTGQINLRSPETLKKLYDLGFKRYRNRAR